MGSILLVDDSVEDNFIHRRRLQQAFPSAGIEVCVNGKEALELLEKRRQDRHPPYDLILLDVNMPVLDGLGFLKAYAKIPVRDHSRYLVLMLATALPTEVQALVDTSPSVCAFIDKPIVAERLLTTLVEADKQIDS